MKVVESPDVSLAKLAEYGMVLAELGRMDKRAEAAELAWAGVEALSARCSPREALTVAGPFLLAVGDSADLRAQTVDLYRAAYSDREDLEELLTEAGLANGRPVRRALRTLEVCLAVAEGSYLVARDDDRAARVEAIDQGAWEFTVTAGGRTETLDAVHLADEFEPALADDFRVMREFSPNELARVLQDDPVSIVVNLCRERSNRIDSDTVESLLVPDVLSPADWKKWWPRARTGLKRNPHITLEGRNPQRVRYSEQPVALEGAFLDKFKKVRDPVKQLELLESFVRENKLRGVETADDALRACYDGFAKRARRLTQDGAPMAGLHWAIVRCAGELANIPDASKGLVEHLQYTADLVPVFEIIESSALANVVCQTLAEARPDDWEDRLLTLLPLLPAETCDYAVTQLIEAGRSAADLEPVVQRILASPVRHFEALLWLWNGPSCEELAEGGVLTTVLTRLLRALEDVRLSDDVAKERGKSMRARAKNFLSARQYARFGHCLDGLEPDLVRALKTQIDRCDGLGPRVRGDLLREIERRIPLQVDVSGPEPWEREEVLFVTEAGLARKQGEIEHHVNVKMLENSRAIGRAAAHGDLSENSEYKFALEERDLLQARLAQMNDEVARAQVIKPEDVPTDHVGIGVTVVFKRVSDGQAYEMTFLGPWEAAAGQGMFNYQAPLSQRLMGKRIGEAVEFDHGDVTGQYEIVALRNAVAQPEGTVSPDS